MGLKDKLVSIASSKLLENVSTGNIDNVINSFLNKAGKLTGEKTTQEYISNLSQSNYLIIQSKSYSSATITNLFVGNPPSNISSDSQGRYRIFDQWGNLRYKSDTENTVSDREIVNLSDANGNQIGRVKEHLFSVGFPGLEKEPKTCSIWYNKERIAQLKKYKAFKETRFTVLDGKVQIIQSKTNNKSIILKYQNKAVAILHRVPINLKDGYVDKYVMEINRPDDEVIGVLLSIAIDIICN